MRIYSLLRIITIFILTAFFAQYSYAQKKKTVTGESQVKVEEYLSTNETKERALEQAKINAITDAFGEYVEQESTLGVESGTVDFHSYGQTKVKGEWIRTIGEPEYSYDAKTADGIIETWITCKVKGEVRELTPKVNIEFEILSCPQKTCTTDEFVNDQNMYMYFKSPVNGYLSIYLDDGSTVYRLLPYRRMSAEKSVEIDADKEYLLFSKEIENFDCQADQIELFTTKDSESNTVIVVFSENEFQKPLLNEEQKDQADYIVPKSLSKNKFEVWLGEQRASDTGLVDEIKRITIVSD